MQRKFVAGAVAVLSLAFIGDLSLADLGWHTVSGVFAGGVGTADGPTRAQACSAAEDNALKNISAEHASRIKDKNCSCTLRGGSIETWRCTASVRWIRD
ncbi:MAG: hypothetical protein GC190_10160 [Alphaproteobacteria bacterium]|nr:hypothetical protein [Alphaproteobacteria bacterium]